jgi:succinate dehydrogenase / fumarate reductase flavoprotein subunit
MSESLRNDGRIWVPRRKDDNRHPNDIPDADRWYYLEERYPSFGNLVPRDIASRAAKSVVDAGHGVGPLKNGVYLDFKDALARLGEKVIRERYGNLFDMYLNITGENPYQVPMRIYPALHYTMGGLWVDYHLMSTIPGLFVLGEANFSDHGANRLGASALMQGLADGYFVAPNTVAHYLASTKLGKVDASHDAFKESQAAVSDRIKRMMSINGKRTVTSFHRELGEIMWNLCGMERTEASLKEALERIPALRAEFWENARILGDADDLNQSLELAGRVADFLEMGELLCIDALHRNESCGGHFRSEYQTPDGEAQRNDEEYSYVAAWQYTGDDSAPLLNKEPLKFDYVEPTQRSYK